MNATVEMMFFLIYFCIDFDRVSFARCVKMVQPMMRFHVGNFAFHIFQMALDKELWSYLLAILAQDLVWSQRGSS